MFFVVGKSVPYGGLAGSMSPKAAVDGTNLEAFDDQCIIDAVPVASTAGIPIPNECHDVTFSDGCNRIFFPSRMLNAWSAIPFLRKRSCHHCRGCLVVDLENRGPLSSSDFGWLEIRIISTETDQNRRETESSHGSWSTLREVVTSVCA